jgi:nucleoside-diphosphate-sugar epimerase
MAARQVNRVRALYARWWLGPGTMRIVVIGGSGHVGSFLVPRLVRAGHEVVSLTCGARAPYVDDEAWSQVEQILVDRVAEDAAGTFGMRVAGLEAKVVVDMICGVAVGLLEGKCQRMRAM